LAAAERLAAGLAAERPADLAAGRLAAEERAVERPDDLAAEDRAVDRPDDFAADERPPDARLAPPERLWDALAVVRLEALARLLDVLLRGSAMCPPSGLGYCPRAAYRAAIRATTGA
jgi:hypothetical protein